MRFVNDKPGKPWCHIMRRIDLIANEQAASDRRAADAGDEGRLEPVATEQCDKPGNIFFKRPARTLEESRKA